MLKIITKIIASKLRNLLEDIVQPNQVTFILSRLINNSIVNYEAMHYINTKKGANGYIAVEVDLAKPYDTVEWKVLSIILKCLSFALKLIDLVEGCI